MGSSDKKYVHNISLEGRTVCTITGIKKVLTSDADEIELLTEQEKLLIKGQNLSIVTLDVSGGILRFNGRIDAVCYLKPGLGWKFLNRNQHRAE